jgi:hypothetical protein
MNVRYWVELSQAERGELTAMLSRANELPASSSAPRYCWRPMPAAATKRLRVRWRWANALGAFRAEITERWRRTLSRRSQKGGLTWARMAKLADDWLHPWPNQRFAVRHPR